MIPNLHPYPEHEPAGLPWVESVPKHWDMIPNRALMQERKVVVGDNAKDYTLLSLTLRGVIARDMLNPKGKFPAQFNTYKVVEPGDFVFCLFDIDETPRGVGLSPLKGMITGAYDVFRPRPIINPRFLYYYYLFVDDGKLMKPFYTGLRKTIQRGVFASLKAPCPPPEEQAAMVRFLDYANGRLERAIRAKRKVIALLHEQKQAIIHSAVTRGLDHTVTLKPSGIPWLGDIPKHWVALQVRRVVSFVTSGSRGWANYYSDNGLIFLQSGNLGRSMALNLSYMQHVRPPDGAEGERTRVRKDDVLVCITGALTGNVALVDQDLPAPAFVNQHVALVRPKQAMIAPRFLAYALHSDVGRTQFKTNEYGGTKQGLGLGDVKSVFIPVPSLEEQRSICTHLDGEVARFRDAISRLEREIELLKEYRTRLVADVVTGKFDVRAAARHLPAEAVEPEAAVDEEELPEPESEEVEA